MKTGAVTQSFYFDPSEMLRATEFWGGNAVTLSFYFGNVVRNNSGVAMDKRCNFEVEKHHRQVFLKDLFMMRTGSDQGSSKVTWSP